MGGGCTDCIGNFCEHCAVVKCKCPQATAWAPGTLGTTYRAEYIKKQGGPSEQTRLPSKGYVASGAPFDGHTTYNADYVNKKPVAARRAGPRNDGPFPYRPFDDSTTNNAYHDAKGCMPGDASSRKQCHYLAPFYGQSSYSAEYPGWQPSEQPTTAPPHRLLSLPFHGVSTYKSDFHKKAIPPRDPHMPPPLLPSSTLGNATTYGADFVELPIIKHKPICCDVPTHRATTVRLTGNPMRPWTPACSSCAGAH